jgi:hypothetical protein
VRLLHFFGAVKWSLFLVRHNHTPKGQMGNTNKNPGKPNKKYIQQIREIQIKNPGNPNKNLGKPKKLAFLFGFRRF